MANGFSDKEMIEMVLEGQAGLQRQVAMLGDKIDAVMNKGCAHRLGDLQRIESLERWRDKGLIGIITTLIISIGSLLAMLFVRNK